MAMKTHTETRARIDAEAEAEPRRTTLVLRPVAGVPGGWDAFRPDPTELSSPGIDHPAADWTKLLVGQIVEDPDEGTVKAEATAGKRGQFRCRDMDTAIAVLELHADYRQAVDLLMRSRDRARAAAHGQGDGDGHGRGPDPDADAADAADAAAALDCPPGATRGRSLYLHRTLFGARSNLYELRYCGSHRIAGVAWSTSADAVIHAHVEGLPGTVLIESDSQLDIVRTAEECQRRGRPVVSRYMAAMAAMAEEAAEEAARADG